MDGETVLITNSSFSEGGFYYF